MMIVDKFAIYISLKKLLRLQHSILLWKYSFFFNMNFVWISQGIQLHSYQLNTQRIYRDLSLLRNDEQFNRATFLFPTRRIEDVYTLHTYFSRVSVQFHPQYCEIKIIFVFSISSI